MDGKTILIVDDTVENLDILADLLSEYDVIEATSGQEALEVLQEEKIDLILLDVMMPEMDGFEVCRRIKKDTQTKDIPIIFITAITDEESIEKAYELGGSDYITKPFKRKELLAKVRREFRLQELQRELRLLATTDPLTKLYNRRYFMDISRHFILTARREGQPLSLFILDIDRFKAINDTYGHDAGDRALIELAEILKSNQRKSDIPCRWGGEEFVVLLPNTSVEGAMTVAEKIRKDIEETPVELSEGKSLKMTVSVGVSRVDVDSEENVEPAIKRADEALYEAKERGRNCVVVREL